MTRSFSLASLALVFVVAPVACGGQTGAPGAAHDAGASDGAPNPSPTSDAGTAADASTALDSSASADGGNPYAPPGFITILQASGGCIPQKLPAGASGEIACEVYEVLPGSTGSCDASQGQSSVDPAVAAAILGKTGGSASSLVCAFQQIAVPAGSGCTTSSSPGWCYATGAGANGCPQTIEVSPGEPPAGAVLVLACPNP
ncbi:MAG TPA: hypothetical protein VGG39_25315 [Polyangiaceae bacterium]